MNAEFEFTETNSTIGKRKSDTVDKQSIEVKDSKAQANNLIY